MCVHLFAGHFLKKRERIAPGKKRHFGRSIHYTLPPPCCVTLTPLLTLTPLSSSSFLRGIFLRSVAFWPLSGAYSPQASLSRLRFLKAAKSVTFKTHVGQKKQQKMNHFVDYDLISSMSYLFRSSDILLFLYYYQLVII